MLSTHDWKSSKRMVTPAKRSLWLGSSHDFETNEQLCNDFLSSRGRFLKISSSNSCGMFMMRSRNKGETLRARRPTVSLPVGALINRFPRFLILADLDRFRGGRGEKLRQI